jgi:hypothetical protein
LPSMTVRNQAMQQDTSRLLRPTLPALTTTLRLLWLMMLTSIVLLVGIAEISAPSSRRGEKIVFEIIAGLVIVIIVSRTIMRRRYVLRGAQQLAKDPTNLGALRRWQTGYILGFAQSAAIAMFGLSLRFMGFTFGEVAPFYAVGFALMLFSRPRAPLEDGWTRDSRTDGHFVLSTISTPPDA